MKIDEKVKENLNKFKELTFDIDKQKEFSKYIAELIGFDFNKGVIKESEHPFTLNFNNKDVRITTHYYEKNILSSIFSTIHEGGHAIYEQQIDDIVSETVLGEGTSMGIHESQSRIFENMFGRNIDFLKNIFNKFDELFDVRSKGIEVEDFYKIVNTVSKSLIRIEADELTYPIHIMIRYELEKEIFSNLDETESSEYIDYLANKWADMYEEFLGVRPTTNSEGISARCSLVIRVIWILSIIRTRECICSTNLQFNE
jgi:carboxypeptidase Taq